MDATVTFKVLMLIILALMAGHWTGLRSNRRRVHRLSRAVDQNVDKIERLNRRLSTMTHPLSTCLWTAYFECLNGQHATPTLTVDQYVAYLRNLTSTTALAGADIFASLKEDGNVYIFIRSAVTSPARVDYAHAMPQKLFHS